LAICAGAQPHEARVDHAGGGCEAQARKRSNVRCARARVPHVYLDVPVNRAARRRPTRHRHRVSRLVAARRSRMEAQYVSAERHPRAPDGRRRAGAGEACPDQGHPGCGQRRKSYGSRPSHIVPFRRLRCSHWSAPSEHPGDRSQRPSLLVAHHRKHALSRHESPPETTSGRPRPFARARTETGAGAPHPTTRAGETEALSGQLRPLAEAGSAFIPGPGRPFGTLA
jgi:hypothetical protein